MKKSLIALAIASAVSAPAFAATANVDVYGVLNLSVNYFQDQFSGYTDTSVTPNVTYKGGEDMQISSNASRIGFKGAEDLGGGLTAIWQIESGINLDEQNGTFASRNSFIGLKGGFGTALIGNHDTPFKLVGRAVDLFGDTIADSRNLMGFNIVDAKIGDETYSFATSDMRADNVIAYISPNWTGFSFAAAYSTDPVSSGNSQPDQTDMSVYSFNATYTNGPFYVGGAYSDGDALEALGQDTNWRLAGGFTFGNFKVVGQYDMYEDESSLGEDYTAWMLGGSWTMGNFVFKGNYIEGEFDNCSGFGCDAEQWALGADYNLSKRTAVYALYVAGQNSALGWGAGASDVNIPDFTDGDNEDISAFSLGVKHSF